MILAAFVVLALIVAMAAQLSLWRSDRARRRQEARIRALRWVNKRKVGP